MLWRLRRAFWNHFTTWKYHHAKPLPPPPSPTPEEPIGTVPFSTRFPHVPIEGIAVAERIPTDEVQMFALRFCQFQTLLNSVFPAMQHDVGEVDANPYDALAEAFTKGHRKCYRAPRRPPGFKGGIDLGEIAVASPYACYLTKGNDGTHRWDLTAMEGFDLHAGVRAPAAVVEFSVDPATSSLRAVRIDSELGVSSEGDSDWDASQRIAMCAATTHLTLVRHFNWIHLVCGAPLALAARNTLPADHPVCRLLWPHLFATQSSNEFVTIVQMNPGGDFEKIFSYTHKGMCELFEATAPGFDMRTVNPIADARLRGVDDAPFATPAHDNRCQLLGVIRDHVARYLDLYYGSDTDVAADEAYAQFVEAVRACMPGGVAELAGTPHTRSGAIELLSTCIYMTTVEHEVVDSGVWDYQLWSDANPLRVYASGKRQPLDVYQRAVNANIILNTPRTPLMDDYSYLARDEPAGAAFQQFQADLASLQHTMDKEPPTSWRIEPRQLKASINA